MARGPHSLGSGRRSPAKGAPRTGRTLDRLVSTLPLQPLCWQCRRPESHPTKPWQARPMLYAHRQVGRDAEAQPAPATPPLGPPCRLQSAAPRPRGRPRFLLCLHRHPILRDHLLDSPRVHEHGNPCLCPQLSTLLCYSVHTCTL